MKVLFGQQEQKSGVFHAAQRNLKIPERGGFQKTFLVCLVSFYVTKSLLLLLESSSETEYPPQEQDFPNDRDFLIQY